MEPNQRGIARTGSGVPGLDELLSGGLVAGRMYLVSGAPGTGKTTVGFHFLEEGLEEGETVLYIHGEESSAEVLENAGQFGIDIADARFLDLGPDSTFFTDDPSYDLVAPGDVEEDRYTREIHGAIEEIDPSRVFLDPITQLRYVETSEHHYRKRLLSFMRFLKERGITVVTTATTDASRESDMEVRSLSDGVIRLTRDHDDRRIEVEKHRGVGQIDGTHGLEIRSSGIEVFPQLVPGPKSRPFDPTPLESGIDELDTLTGGGFERGTVTFISGPPGVGKTTVGTQFLTRAADRGQRGVIYLFEEREETLRHRCRSIGIDVDGPVEDGSLTVRAIDPQSLSAEEFGHDVRTRVEAGAEVVMIDGVGGYTSALKGDEATLQRKLQTLARYLVHHEVSAFVTDSMRRITGVSSVTGAEISPAADNLLFLSYLESNGMLRRVIGVLKKRAGDFEDTIREFEITPDGIRIGEPMRQYGDVLRGGTRPPGDPDTAGGSER